MKGQHLKFIFLLRKKKENEEFPKKDILKLSKGKILIMDDDEMILDVSKKLLKQLKFQVETALHGEEAIELYLESI